MSHSPPIPPGNQSIYPLTEQRRERVAVNNHPHARRTPAAAGSGKNSALLLLGGLATGIAAGAALIWASRRSDEDQKAKPTKRTTAQASRTKPSPAAKKPIARSPRTPKSKGPKGGNVVKPVQRRRRASGDDKTERGPQDASRVAMGEDYEVRYWTKKFGVDRDKLQRAVDVAGTSVSDVEIELKRT